MNQMEEAAAPRPRSGFSGLVGAVIDDVGPGRGAVSVQRRPELLQMLGYMHGGCIAFLVDYAAGVAAHTLLPPGQAVVTAEFKLNFLAPARGERVVCRARVIKPGRRLNVVACDVYSEEAGAEVHAATALVTIAFIRRPVT